MVDESILEGRGGDFRRRRSRGRKVGEGDDGGIIGGDHGESQVGEGAEEREMRGDSSNECVDSDLCQRRSDHSKQFFYLFRLDKSATNIQLHQSSESSHRSHLLTERRLDMF